MSLYNTLFGTNPFTDILLGFLSTTHQEIPRFRDVFIDSDEIVIYTRTGGGNRDHYDAPECASPSNADLRKLTGFVRDYDDDFDSTFAYFRYTVPEQYRDAVGKIVELSKDRPPPRERFDQLMKAMDEGQTTPETERARKIGQEVADRILAGEKIIKV